MNTNKKNKKVSNTNILILICLIGITICSLLLTSILINTYLLSEPKNKDNVFVFIDTGKGRELISSGHNVITNIGEKMHRNFLGFNNVSSYDTCKYISAGNATSAQTLTKLTTEATSSGFERGLGSVTQYNTGNDYGFNVTITFTATAIININCFGLHWISTGDTDNNMYACNGITAQTFSVGSKAIVIWLNSMDDN